MKEEFKNVAAILVPYSIFCSGLYLYFYWQGFDVQPLEYIGLSDVLSYSVPFLIFSFGCLFPILVSEYFRPAKYPVLEIEGKSKQEIIFNVILIVLLNFVLVVVALFEGIYRKEITYGVLGALYPLTLRLSYVKDVSSIFGVRGFAILVTLFVCCMPATSITYALITKMQVKERTEYKILPASDVTSINENGYFVYLGRLGDYIFVQRENEANTIAIRISDFKKIEITKIRR